MQVNSEHIDKWLALHGMNDVGHHTPDHQFQLFVDNNIGIGWVFCFQLPLSVTPFQSFHSQFTIQRTNDYFWFCRKIFQIEGYGVSYRDLEEIMEERGVQVDHATLNRWVINYSPLISAEAKKSKRTVATSWRMDETYIKVKGKWVYLHRAVDKFGDTIDFMLSEQRDEMAATAFFKQAINNNGFPHKVVMDKSGANYAGIENINRLLMLAGLISFIEICQVKYLNSVIEQDHRFIKKITNPMMGFKAFHSARATIEGIETAHMIRKKQLSENNVPAYKQFMALAG